MKIIAPVTSSDFEKYYQLRFAVLREPWHQPPGSEKAPDDTTAIHALLINKQEEALGVCRLSFGDQQEGQIRFMAIRPDFQGQGLGKQLLQYLEIKAAEKGATFITLQARENAVKFYESCGYKVLEKTHLLFNEIQHYKMQKNLTSVST